MKHSQQDIILIIREYIKNPLAYPNLHNYRGNDHVSLCRWIQIRNIRKEIRDLSRKSWIFDYLYSMGNIQWVRLIEAIEKDITIQKPTKQKISSNDLYVHSLRSGPFYHVPKQ